MKNAVILEDLSRDDLGAIIDSKLKTHFEGLKEYLKGNGESDLLSREETCKFLNITSTTLWSYTNQGRIKAHAIGNRRYYKKSELLEALTPVKTQVK